MNLNVEIRQEAISDAVTPNTRCTHPKPGVNLIREPFLRLPALASLVRIARLWWLPQFGMSIALNSVNSLPEAELLLLLLPLRLSDFAKERICLMRPFTDLQDLASRVNAGLIGSEECSGRVCLWVLPDRDSSVCAALRPDPHLGP